VALSQNNAVEEDKAHHAAHVHQNDSDRERGQNTEDDQRSENGEIESCNVGVRRRTRMMWKREVGSVESAGTELSRKQSYKRQLCPLTNAERIEQLLLRVLNRGRDRVYGGNSQGSPQAANASAARY
jgi:hypothetical protein